MIAGSIPYFLALGEEEQSMAITNNYFPPMEFLINTQHNYAALLLNSKGFLGENLQLGGLSDENEVEAMARSFFQVGYQFHPENMYYNPEDKDFGRNNNLLKNVFKFFLLDRDKVDLDAVNDYMLTELSKSFSDAICITPEENICLASHGFVRDIYHEAVTANTLTVND
jgi:hypothetical protein